MIGLIELLAVGYAIFVVFLIAYCAWMLTHPHRKTYAWAVARGRPGDPSELPGAGRGFSAWTFASRGRTFGVWDIAGDGGPGAPVVILSHGWADSRLGGLLRVPHLAPWASRLILWDLRGHGEAPGVCRLGTVEVEDLLALIEAVAGCGVAGTGAGGDSHRLLRAVAGGTGSGGAGIMLYGWSLGAGVSIAAAARSGAVCGVIAEAPYRLAITPARNVMRGLRLPYRLNLPPAMWLLGMLFGVGSRWRGFDRGALAAGLGCPLLVIHGEHDAVCPVADGREIGAAGPRGALVVVAGARHNDLWTEPAFAGVCGGVVGRFLGDLAAERAGAAAEPA